MNSEMLKLVEMVTHDAFMKIASDHLASNDEITEDFLKAFIDASNKVHMNRDMFYQYCDNIYNMYAIIYHDYPWLNNIDIIKVRKTINKVRGEGACFIEHVNSTDTFVVHLVSENDVKLLTNLMKIYQIIYPEIDQNTLKTIYYQFIPLFNYMVKPVNDVRKGNLMLTIMRSILNIMNIPYTIKEKLNYMVYPVSGVTYEIVDIKREEE